MKKTGQLRLFISKVLICVLIIQSLVHFAPCQIMADPVKPTTSPSPTQETVSEDMPVPEISEGEAGEEPAGDGVSEDAVSSYDIPEEAVSADEAVISINEVSDNEAVSADNVLDFSRLVGGYIPLPGSEDKEGDAVDVSSLDEAGQMLEGEDGEDCAGRAVPAVYPAGADNHGHEAEVIEQRFPGLRYQCAGYCWSEAAMALMEFGLISKGWHDRTGVVDNTIDYSERQDVYHTYTKGYNDDGYTDHDDVYYGRSVDYSNNIYQNGGNGLVAGSALMHYFVGQRDKDEYTTDKSKDKLGELRGPFDVETSTVPKEYSDINRQDSRLKDYYELNIKTSPELVKQAVMDHGAVGLNYAAWDYNWWGDRQDEYKYYSYEHNSYNDKYSRSNHAVCIVGWDDGFSRENFVKKPEHDGAWLIRNSWGGGMFKNVPKESLMGYFWMSYESGSIDDYVYVYDLADPDREWYDNIYAYDGYASVFDVYTPSNTLANVYTARKGPEGGDEVIEAVQIETCGSADYTIRIYAGLTDPDDPTSGTELTNSRTTGTIAYPRYGGYTVKLRREARIHHGESFSVVVETSKNILEASCSENKIGSMKFIDVAEPGQSFALVDGVWKDLGIEAQCGNAHIRPLTDNSDTSVACIRNLCATSVSYDSVTLSWDRTPGACDGFTITRNTREDGSYQIVGETSADVMTFTDTGLSDATDYYYVVYGKYQGSTIMSTDGALLHVLTKNIPGAPEVSEFETDLSPVVYDGQHHPAKITASDDSIRITGIKYAEVSGGETGDFSDEVPVDTGDYAFMVISERDGRSSRLRSPEWVYSITKRTLTVTPKNMHKNPQEPDPVLEFTYTGTVSGQTPSFNGTLERKKGEDSGRYLISQGDLRISDNAPFLASNYAMEVTGTAYLTIGTPCPEPVCFPEPGTPVSDGDRIVLSVSQPGLFGVCYRVEKDRRYTTPRLDYYTAPIKVDPTSVKDGMVTIRAFAYSLRGTALNSEDVYFRFPYAPQESLSDDVAGDDLAEAPRDSKGNISAKVWIAGVPVSAQYTGKAITFPVRVYYGNQLMSAKTDYTLKFIDNKKAGTAKVSVKGKGQFTKTLVKEFAIVKPDIGSEAFHADWIADVYNGRTKKPSPALTWNGKKLKKDRDYTVEYLDKDGSLLSGGFSSEGEYRIRLKGAGSFDGSRTVRYSVISKDSPYYLGKAKIKGLEKSYAYDDGKPVTPRVTVELNGSALAEGRDYEVICLNSTEVGKARLVIQAMGSYVGSKSVSFKIEGKKIGKASFAGFKGSAEYTGFPISQDAVLTMDGRTLVEGNDYSVSYKKNTNAGTATAIYKGLNGFAGSTVKKTFKITPVYINSLSVETALPDSLEFLRGGVRKPDVVLRMNGKYLKEGKDYTVSARRRSKKEAGWQTRPYQYRVKGRGNFNGFIGCNAREEKADIVNMEVYVPDVKYVAGNNWRSKWIDGIWVKDSNGKKLKWLRDYGYIIVPFYPEDIVLTDGQKRNRFEDVEPDADEAKVPAGTELAVRIGVGDVVTVPTDSADAAGTASAVISKKEEGYGEHYRNMKLVYFSVYEHSVNDVDFRVKDQYYTGRQIRPGKDQIETSCDSYDIIGYGKNIKKGKGTVIIRGHGMYGETKTVKFNILPRSVEK